MPLINIQSPQKKYLIKSIHRKKNAIKPFCYKYLNEVTIPIIIKNINKGIKITKSKIITRYVNIQIIQTIKALYMLSLVKNGSSLNYHQLVEFKYQVSTKN